MMKLSGLQKLTLLDFPGKTAATVFTPGCNFRCPFCHNSDLVVGEIFEGHATFPEISLEEFFSFLEKRHGLLDGICITGGEPLLQNGIEDFCRRIKAEGFAIKLDTNGSFPEKLRALVDAGLIDYVAMDVKNSPARYGETVGLPAFDSEAVQASIDYLLRGAIPYEFRTTVVRELHDAESLRALACRLKGASAWYLQSFIDAETVLAGPQVLHPYTPEELQALLPPLQAIIGPTHLRGV
ncbi:MAG: anaerobic ribonucleoside-triphosphate reductase activating protein [Raoultibacter sp.]